MKSVLCPDAPPSLPPPTRTHRHRKTPKEPPEVTKWSPNKPQMKHELIKNDAETEFATKRKGQLVVKDVYGNIATGNNGINGKVD